MESEALVVDPVECVLPEDVQNSRFDKEAVDAHPETVHKGGDCESGDKDGHDCGDKDDESFRSNEIEEEPHDELEESIGIRAKVDHPVGDAREEDGNEDCIMSSCQRLVNVAIRS